MKIIRNLMSLMVLILAFNACEEEQSAWWNISGSVLMADSSIPEITTPVENVKVYLLAAPIKIDSVKGWFSKSCIFDSTFTNSNGLYSFDKVPRNEYVVMPVDSVLGYEFSWEESPDSIWLSIDQQKTEFTINFITPEPKEENLFGPYFSFTFHYYNKIEYHSRLQAFRTARENFGCGWMGLSSCDWYWEPYYTGGTGTFSVVENQVQCNDDGWGLKSGSQENSASDWWNDVRIVYDQDASGFFTDYKDEFHFKFYYDDNRLYTMNISGDELHDENEFDVYWFEDHVEITRIK